MAPLTARLDAVRRQIRDAEDSVGSPPGSTTLVAVTKTVGIDVVTRLIDLGVTDFGENRVQEFIGKYGLFPHVNWHFIGTLQTNKAKDVVGKAHLIHSVDTVRLLDRIESLAADLEVAQAVLLQVNVSGEASKHGFDPTEMMDVLEHASRLEWVKVKGLMTMAPLGAPDVAAETFRKLRVLAEELSACGYPGVELDELSMGMSGDFTAAIEAGATIVRVGSALYGRQ